MIDVTAWLKGRIVHFDGNEVSYPDGRTLALKAVEAMRLRIKRFTTPKKCPHCDCAIDFENPRSTPQLRRYFAMVRAFHHHWPEYHPEQFEDADNFRRWLQMKSGPEYRVETARIPLAGVDPDKALMMVKAGMLAMKGFAYPVVHKGFVVIFQAKSIAYDAMAHKDFCRLSDDVAATFEAQTGLKASEVFREHEGAA